jgi:hypothetical protein
MLLGDAVAGVGDLNGDGQPEVLVGASKATPGTSTEAGSVFLLDAKHGRLLHRLDGSGKYSWFGSALAAARDVDGDGVQDFIIGAYGAPVSGVGIAGKAYVYSGASLSLLFSVDGSVKFGALGYSVSGAGDVNGDGLGDVVIGAPLTWIGGLPEFGKACVHLGAAGASDFCIEGTVFGGNLGTSVAGVGDVNGDGYDDIAVGVPFDSFGAVCVYSGATALLLDKIDGQGGQVLGRSVANAGDIDHDGVDDLLIGAPETSFLGQGITGEVIVYSVAKATILLAIPGEHHEELFGYVVASAGDVDGDGTPDIVGGAPLANASGVHESGLCRVHSGKTGSKLLEIKGTSPVEHMGASIGDAGDVDGDGRSDVIVGAPNADPRNVHDAGMALVVGL